MSTTTTLPKVPETKQLHGKADEKPHKMKPQTERVLNWLLKNGSITQLQASNMLGVGRLASRIWELRNWHGVAVDVDMVERINRFAEKVHVAKYTLALPA